VGQSRFKEPARDLVGGFQLLKCGLKYLLTGEASPQSNLSLIRLFCATSGRSNDFLAKCVSLFSSSYSIPQPKGVLGDYSALQIKDIVSKIDEDGYYVFKKKLSPDICQKILDLGLTKDSNLVSPVGETKTAVYDRKNPMAVKYDVILSELLKEEIVQNLIADESIIAVAQSYLGAKPILDIVALWWSTAREKPDSEAAQFFHFDMDRVKWLKFFFYITDVSPQNGPHCFIKGSHKAGGIPRALLKHGYSRLPDEKVQEFYTEDQFVEFTGPVGTIIAEDTRGLHKGKAVEKGDRLIFQLEFTNTLFGAKHQEFLKPQRPCEKFLEAMGKYPSVFKIFNGGERNV
jgi:ectoine hydroxylase-related dioxygenase (phytanoyl-CoA dioxygenase family)